MPRAADGGQDLAEYGIALSIVGVVAIAAAIAIGLDVALLWDPVESSIESVHGHRGNHNGHGNGHGNGNGNSNGNGNGNG